MGFIPCRKYLWSFEWSFKRTVLQSYPWLFSTLFWLRRQLVLSYSIWIWSYSPCGLLEFEPSSPVWTDVSTTSNSTNHQCRFNCPLYVYGTSLLFFFFFFWGEGGGSHVNYNGLVVEYRSAHTRGMNLKGNIGNIKKDTYS